MYLYSKRNGMVDVYSFEPDVDKVREYKIQEMEKLKSKSIIFKAVTNETNFPLAAKKIKDNLFIDFDEINYFKKKFLGKDFHIINTNGYSIEDRDRILRDFYNNRFLNDEKIVVATEKSLIHLLLTQDEYTLHPEKRGLYVMMDIMYLPETLVHLHNLENGKVKPLRYFSSEIDKLAPLFDLSEYPLFSVECEEINLLNEFGFLNGQEINEKITGDTELVKTLQKRNNKKVF